MEKVLRRTYDSRIETPVQHRKLTDGQPVKTQNHTCHGQSKEEKLKIEMKKKKKYRPSLIRKVRKCGGAYRDCDLDIMLRSWALPLFHAQRITN
jgi:hypothetical protein